MFLLFCAPAISGTVRLMQSMTASDRFSTQPRPSSNMNTREGRREGKSLGTSQKGKLGCSMEQ